MNQRSNRTRTSIISDEPLSAETNYRTEFVAVLSNQPQGGFITGEPTTDFAAMDAQGDDSFGHFFQRGWGSQRGNLSTGATGDYQRSWGFQPAPSATGARNLAIRIGAAIRIFVGSNKAGNQSGVAQSHKSTRN